MPFFSISSLSAWTSFCCRCRRASSVVTRPWKSAFARLPASHSLSARCTSTKANFSSACAGTAADITARNALSIAPMNNRCLIQSGKPPVDYLSNSDTRPHGASLVQCEIYTLVLDLASNPVAHAWAVGRAPEHRLCGHLAKLQRRAPAHFEHRVLVGWPRVNRESDIDRQRPERRFPAHTDAGRSLQIVEVHAVLQQERLSCVAEYNAADSQSRQNRESDFVAEQQLLAAADVLHAQRRAVLTEDRHLRSQRIELVAAHVARTADAAGKKSFVQRQLAAGAALQVGADAVSDSLRQHEGAERLALQERVEISKMRDALDELVRATETANLHGQTLDRSRARIGRIIHREALYRRCDFRGLRVALVALDLERRELVQPGDPDALEGVAQPRGHVLERERPDLFESQLSQRISRRQREACRRLVEAQQVGLVVEQLHAHAERDIEEPRLGVADAVVLEQEAYLRVGDQRFTAAEQVGVAQREVTEQRLITVESARDLERRGVGLCHVHVQVYLVRLRRR